MQQLTTHLLLLIVSVHRVRSSSSPSPGCGMWPSNADRFKDTGDSRNETNPGDWPWMVSLLHNNRFLCTGSLIDANVVLTAAHCVDKVQTNRVRMGRLTRDKPVAIERSVASIAVHENWQGVNESHLGYDLALVRLSDPVPVSQRILPICLPTSDFDLEAQLFLPAGWRTNQPFGRKVSKTLYVMLPMMKANQCPSIPKHQLCARYTSGSVSDCRDHSGGPLMMKTSNGSWVVAGIKSYGFGCSRPDNFGIYARVSSHRKWIEWTMMEQEIRDVEARYGNGSIESLCDEVYERLVTKYDQYTWLVKVSDGNSPMATANIGQYQTMVHTKTHGNKNVVIFQFSGPNYSRSHPLRTLKFLRKTRTALAAALQQKELTEPLQILQRVQEMFPSFGEYRQYIVKTTKPIAWRRHRVSYFDIRIGDYYVLLCDFE